jgi:O-antigen/teichoic acid export membrane protein
MRGITYQRARATSSEPYAKLALLYFAYCAAGWILAAIILWLWKSEVTDELYVLYFAVLTGGIVLTIVKIIEGRIIGRPFFKEISKQLNKDLKDLEQRSRKRDE